MRGLQEIDNWGFDVFQINEIGEGHALKYVGLELLQKYDLISKYKVRQKWRSSRYSYEVAELFY